MADFNSVLNAAQQLGAEDQLRLINALWDIVPADAEVALHEDWGPELERRVAAVDAGQTTLTAWSTIREAALSRLDHGTAR
jgi:putative addiction module component (TIGR02574 family)